jgi:hypothetical protein
MRRVDTIGVAWSVATSWVGDDIRPALLWSSERVHTTSYLTCTATMDAVRAAKHHTTYGLTRKRLVPRGDGAPGEAKKGDSPVSLA